MVFICLYLVVIFWLFRTTRAVLFYLYLWQLKEYRLERFLDYFHTAQGKQLFVNKVFLVKVCILSALLLSLWAIVGDFGFGDYAAGLLFFAITSPFFALTALYALEALRIRQSRRPAFTKKIIFLFGILFIGEILAVLLVHQFSNFLYVVTSWNLFASLFAYPIGLLAIDLLMPVIVSAVVLGLQPFTVLVRNRRLAKAKAKRLSFPNVKVVGITGSYGKTSTKEFLAHILSAKFRVLKTPEHQNSEFGVANTILNKLAAEHQVFVCEMGAYKKGEIKALAEVAQPQIGIVTGVNEQHLATFGSMENLLSAEGGEELADVLPDGGVMFINQNSRLRPSSYGGQAKITYYGQAENVKIEKDKVLFEVDGTKFEVPAYGGHNVQNLLGAIGAARELGMDLQEIAKAAASMPLELSPLKVKKGNGGITIIDSTYSANPDGVIADLNYLGLYEGKKVLVMPSLIELGPAAKEAHNKIGRKIAEVCDLAVITTKEHFEDIKQGADNSEKVVYMENAQEIMGKIKGADIILLEGGKESRLQRALVRTFRD